MLFFPSHQITIYRRRRVGSTNRYSMSATLTVSPADIQPASVERTQFAEGHFGAVFDAYVEESLDIKEGDQIITNGKRYSVKGVSRFEDGGMLPHKQILLVAQDG